MVCSNEVSIWQNFGDINTFTVKVTAGNFKSPLISTRQGKLQAICTFQLMS